MQYSQKSTIRVARVSPAETLEALLKVVDTLGTHGAIRIRISVFTSVRSFSDVEYHPGRDAEKQNEDLKAIRTEIPGRSWELIRSAEVGWVYPGGDLRLQFHRDDAQVTDSVAIEHSGSADGADKSIPLHAAIAGAFQPLTWPAARFAGLPDELKAFHRAQEETFAAREAAILEARLNLERTQSRELEAREEFRAELVAKFEDERKERAAALEVERATLKAKESALARARAELDDRQRMHARRESIKDMKALITTQKEGVKISPETVAKRAVVHWTCVVAMVVSGILYGVAATWLHGDPSAIFPIAMIATASVVFGSTLIYFLRWSDRWFARHAAEAFEVRRREFALLGSANIVEMLFEWQKESEGKRDFPPELLRVLARELMPSAGTADVTTHPFGDALSAFDRFRKVEVGGKHGFRLERGDDAKPT